MCIRLALRLLLLLLNSTLWLVIAHRLWLGQTMVKASFTTPGLCAPVLLLKTCIYLSVVTLRQIQAQSLPLQQGLCHALHYPIYLRRMPSLPRINPLPFSLNLMAYRLPAT